MRARNSGLTPESFEDKDSFFVLGKEPNRVDVLMGIPGVDFESAWDNREASELHGIKLSFIGIRT